MCVDVVECDKPNVCPKNSTCRNSPGSFSCQCDIGFEKDSCSDINECTTDICGVNAVCFNTLGSYDCSCKDGFYGDGYFCIRGQCPDSNCPFNQKCVSPTGLDCECKEGFQLDEASSCSEIINTTASPPSTTATANSTTLMTTASATPTLTASTTTVSPTTTSPTSTSTTTTTTTTSEAVNNTSVLVLHSWYDFNKEYKSWNPVTLIASSGEKRELSCFQRGHSTEILWSCSILWENEQYVFGGASDKHQISRFNRYELERIGELSFNFSPGVACGVMNKQIYLCFGRWQPPESKMCRRSSGPLEEFTFDSFSKYDHSPIQLGNTKSK